MVNETDREEQSDGQRYEISTPFNKTIVGCVIHYKPVSCYSRQLVRLNNMPVMGSSPKWTVPLYVGLTILLRGVIHKSLKAKLTSGTQALTDNGC